jgi:LacI family transcriptional regulator
LCKSCNYNFTLFHQKPSKKTTFVPSQKQTTIIDIANAMGVSVTTVSRSLHNHPDISKKTKEAVKALADEMDYQPNLLAKGFANKKTRTIGVIIPNLETTFFSTMLSGIQQEASKADYKVMICLSNETHKTEVANVQTLMSNWIDGLLICHSIETENFDHLNWRLKKNIPVINFYRVSMYSELSKVVGEDVEGAEKITEHLIEQGCKRIAIIVGPKNLLITQKRLQGYKNVLEKYNYPYNEQLVAHTDYVKTSVIQKLDEWLALDERPDAIFSISDKCAIYTMQYLKEKKIKIPDEICVAGFGNDTMGEVIEPGLTSFDVHTLKIGEAAAQLFFEEVNNDNSGGVKTRLIKGDLIIRGSTLKKGI